MLDGSSALYVLGNKKEALSCLPPLIVSPLIGLLHLKPWSVVSGLNVWPLLGRYMHSRHFLESLTVVLSTPAASAHPSVLQALKDLLRFLARTQQGLLFLMSEHEATNLLVRVLTQISEADAEPEAGAGPGDAPGEDGFAVWLMQVLHALQGVAELLTHCGAQGGLEEGDSAEVLGTLHALYLITFSSTGRAAVSHVFSLEHNFSCLLTLMEHYSKEGQG